jgi:hypothetical protein
MITTPKPSGEPGTAQSRRRLQSAFAWLAVGYVFYLFAVPLAPKEKDIDLAILFRALIVLGGVAFVMATVRLVQFVVARCEERVARG